MSKKIEETIVIRNEKMTYAVRLCSKLDGEGSRIENRNPYMVVEDGKIKYIDSLYGHKSEFNFADEVHMVAKEIFINGLRTAIKEEILRLKQLELVLNEMGLTECIGNTLEESATFLQKVRGFIESKKIKSRKRGTKHGSSCIIGKSNPQRADFKY